MVSPALFLHSSIPDAKPGVYYLKVDQHQQRLRRDTFLEASQYTAFAIVSPPLGPEQILLEGWISNQLVDENSTKEPLTIAAKLQFGKYRLVKANVWAIVSSPQGETRRINLADDGQGSDIRRDDGIYSADVNMALIPGQRLFELT